LKIKWEGFSDGETHVLIIDEEFGTYYSEVLQ